MMTKTCSFSFRKLILLILIFSLFCFSIFAEDGKNWTVAAEKFVLEKGQLENAVTSGIGETIPKSILEKLNQVLTRNIRADEKLERKRYELRTKRQSLYLQLSSEYKKRDSLFLKYSGNKLQKKLKDQNNEINKIKKEIDDNLLELKNAEENFEKELLTEQENQLLNQKTSEVTKTAKFFKSIISNDKSFYSAENIKIYNNNPESLIEISEKAKEGGYKGSLFEKEIYGKGINGLITGSISGYGEYISVSADFYLYPGGEKIATVMEIGSLNDLELIALSIVSQLIPIMTNSMPVTLRFNITPLEAKDDFEIYIDDVIQKIDSNKLLINSGVHSFKIASKQYKSVGVNYYFDGNTEYIIDVTMQPKNEGSVIIQLQKPLLGDTYVNGQLTEKLNDSQSKVIINGTEVLGQFISQDGNTAFFYIPEKLYFDENVVSINPKAIDRAENIDKRRRWMYGAYSGFMISLIPTFILKGQLMNSADLYYENHIDYQTAHNLEIASNVSVGLTIGAGVFWAIELVRYLIAANSVLPQKAKQTDLIDYNSISKNQSLEIEKNMDDAVDEKSAASGDKK